MAESLPHFASIQLLIYIRVSNTTSEARVCPLLRSITDANTLLKYNPHSYVKRVNNGLTVGSL